MAEKKQKDYCDMTTNELAKLMAGPSQLKRKNAAKVLLARVKENPEGYKKNIPDFIDALSRPEAQTRWLALDSLTYLVPIDAKACKSAIDGAEEALFDEGTSLIRESALRFLSRYGSTSVQRSKEVWPLIKDALQQYHGEIDYDKYINRITFFATGKLDSGVKRDFRSVVRDISNSVGGPTKARLDRILNILKGQDMAKTTKKAAKKTAAKKTVKKATPKKKVTKKATPKKTTKKATPKKKVTKKATPKKKVAKKATPKKKVAKKTTKKATPKKKVAKKATPKKKVAKKTAAKKTTKKATSKKATPKKKVAKKPAKKTAKKATKKTAKKPVKKVAAKKTAKKKSAPKKSKKK